MPTLRSGVDWVPTSPFPLSSWKYAVSSMTSSTQAEGDTTPFVTIEKIRDDLHSLAGIKARRLLVANRGVCGYVVVH